MKFLALFVFIGALWWSWHLTYSDADIRTEVHSSIQIEVQSLIREYIAKHRPTASEITFHKIWTETLKPDRVKVVFQYSFSDLIGEGEQKIAVENTEQVFDGYAVLNRMAPDNSSSDKANGDENWSLDEVSADNTTVIFKKGVEVSP